MGKYFTENERYQLETMLQDGIHKKEIADRLGKSLATIYNEIKRGTVELLSYDWTTYQAYKADVAQKDFLQKQTAKGANYKIGNDFKMVDFIETKMLNEKWSPETIIGYLKANQKMVSFDTDICFKTLYNYIHAGLFLHVSEKNLLHYRKRKKKKSIVPALHNLRGTSISERPEIVQTREEYGHWEMDTVIGQRGKKSCLLVLSERKTRTEIVRKISEKTQDAVKTVLDNLEKQLGTESFQKHFKSITTDNGVEFLNAEKIENSIYTGKRTKSYFCHPFSSWERGTNENINKMIRRWIPKGADITQYTEQQISYIEHWVNTYPRKMFGFRSSRDILQELEIAVI